MNPPSLSGRKYAWVAFLYFAEGLPFGLVNNALPVAFSKSGVDLKQIGLLALAGLPWTFKFLWAPAVDRLGRRRQWISGCLAAMGLLVMLFPLRLGQAPSLALWACIIAVAALSATQDVAIDAATIEFLEEREMGAANGVRVTFYRLALIAAGGLMVAAAGAAGWDWAWKGSGAVLLLLAIGAWRTPCGEPRPAALAAEGWSGLALRSIGVPLACAWAAYAAAGALGWKADYRTAATVLTGLAAGTAMAFSAAGSAGEGLKRLLSKPEFPWIVLFVLLFKLGDTSMAMMTFPFLDKGAGLSTAEIGFLQGTLVVAATVGGALLGGALTNRWGLMKALVLLGALQAVSNLGYTAASFMPGKAIAYSAAIFEGFCGGLGTAPFLAFMMTLCDKEHAATQYAFLTATYGLSRSIAGAFSGYLATPLGFGPYFALTFLLALPAFALIPKLGRGAPPSP